MKTKTITSIIVLTLGLLLLTGAAYAETTGYDLHWWTVDGGGGHLSGTGYDLSATIGQPDAGRLTGNGYILAGGFWGGGTLTSEDVFIYLPLIMR